MLKQDRFSILLRIGRPSDRPGMDGRYRSLRAVLRNRVRKLAHHSDHRHRACRVGENRVSHACPASGDRVRVWRKDDHLPTEARLAFLPGADLASRIGGCPQLRFRPENDLHLQCGVFPGTRGCPPMRRGSFFGCHVSTNRSLPRIKAARGHAHTLTHQDATVRNPAPQQELPAVHRHTPMPHLQGLHHSPRHPIQSNTPRRQPMEQVIVRCAPRTGRLLPHRRAVPRRLPRPLQVRQTGTRPATGFQKQPRTPQTVRRNDRGLLKIEGLHRNSWFCLRIHLPPKFVTRWGGTFSPK